MKSILDPSFKYVPSAQTDIRKTFARRWVERGAQPGWYYQNTAGTWTQK